MLTVRNYSMLLKVCSYSFRRRSSCRWLLVSAGPKCSLRKAPAVGRSFTRSLVSSQSTENTEDTVPEELADMRSRMSKLHNVVSDKGVTLAHYKPTIDEDEENDTNDSMSLEEGDSEGDHFEDSPDDIKSLLGGSGKGLRKDKEDVDVVVNMPYGNVRFDSMNRLKSTLQAVSEKCGVAHDNIPSVKVIKDGHHVFSINAEKDGHLSEHVEMDETYLDGSQSESEISDAEVSLFDEQYFDEVLQDEQQTSKQEKDSERRHLTKNTTTNRRQRHPNPNVFDEQYFGDSLEKSKMEQSSLSNSQSSRRDLKLSDIEASGHPKVIDDVDEQLSVIDEQYFGSYASSSLPESQQIQEDDIDKRQFSSSGQMSHSQQDNRHSLEAARDDMFQQYSRLTESITPQLSSAPVWKEVEDMIKDSVKDDDNTVVVEPITRREMKARTRPRPDIENPKTAYDLSRKIRLEQQQKLSADDKKQQMSLGMNQRSFAHVA